MSMCPNAPPPWATDNDARSNVRPRMFDITYANDALLAEYLVRVSKREFDRHPRSQLTIASHVAHGDDGSSIR